MAGFMSGKGAGGSAGAAPTTAFKTPAWKSSSFMRASQTTSTQGSTDGSVGSFFKSSLPSTYSQMPTISYTSTPMTQVAAKSIFQPSAASQCSQSESITNGIDKQVPVAKPKRKFTKTMASTKAGIVFPPGRIYRHLKQYKATSRVSGAAGVHLAAVLEYLIAELLELAGNAAKVSTLGS
eukprot:GHVT01072336.1.p1 GENE.GHVT01072336.1~~GHVT01072336.1.p1  ORF type:complete len:180 (-),score=20.33 GHVT01072336.1:4178-4717(-)